MESFVGIFERAIKTATEAVTDIPLPETFVVDWNSSSSMILPSKARFVIQSQIDQLGAPTKAIASRYLASLQTYLSLSDTVVMSAIGKLELPAQDLSDTELENRYMFVDSVLVILRQMYSDEELKEVAQRGLWVGSNDTLNVLAGFQLFINMVNLFSQEAKAILSTRTGATITPRLPLTGNFYNQPSKSSNTFLIVSIVFAIMAAVAMAFLFWKYSVKSSSSGASQMRYYV